MSKAPPYGKSWKKDLETMGGKDGMRDPRFKVMHQCESNIRRWLIEKDWLEAIVALPLNLFYNTGIATYVWVLSNRKHAHRQGQVQLIDASGWFKPLRTLEEISADILAIEKEAEGLLDGLLKGGKG